MIELEHSTFTYYPKEEKEEAANNLHFFVVITSFEDSAITSGDLLGRQAPRQGKPAGKPEIDHFAVKRRDIRSSSQDNNGERAEQQLILDRSNRECETAAKMRLPACQPKCDASVHLEVPALSLLAHLFRR